MRREERREKKKKGGRDSSSGFFESNFKIMISQNFSSRIPRISHSPSLTPLTPLTPLTHSPHSPSLPLTPPHSPSLPLLSLPLITSDLFPGRRYCEQALTDGISSPTLVCIQHLLPLLFFSFFFFLFFFF